MALEWQPRYPDAFPSRRLRLSQPFVVNLDPIVNPPPPTEYAAHVTFPAQAPRRFLPTASQLFYVAGTQFLGTALRNFAIYPDRLVRPSRAHSFQTFEIGGILDVPKIGGWRPRFPMQLHLAPRAAQGFYAFVTPPSVILNAAACVEWTDETLTNPVLASETLTNPAMTEETLTSPTMTEEDLC